MLDAAKPIDLMGQWINGNKKDVANELAEMTPHEVAVTMAVIAGLRPSVVNDIGTYLVKAEVVKLIINDNGDFYHGS